MHPISKPPRPVGAASPVAARPAPDEARIIDVRPLAPTDKPAWLAIMKKYLAFYAEPPNLPVLDATFAKMTDPHAPVHGQLAWQTGVAVGMANYTMQDHTYLGTVCYLSDLYVAEDARRQGIAHRLIASVGAHATMLGCAKVHWVTNPDNESAMALYKTIAQQTHWVRFEKIIPDAEETP